MSYEDRRDEAINNVWLSPDVKPQTLTDFETFEALFTAGADWAHAEMMKDVAGLVEFLEENKGHVIAMRTVNKLLAKFRQSQGESK